MHLVADKTADGNAEVAELADAHGSGPCGSNTVRVQVSSSASEREVYDDFSFLSYRKDLAALLYGCYHARHFPFVPSEKQASKTYGNLK